MIHSLALLAAVPLALAAPIITPRSGDIIAGKYIVKMKSSGEFSSIQSAMSVLESEPDFVYDMEKFQGFAATLSDEAVEQLSNNPDVCQANCSSFGS